MNFKFLISNFKLVFILVTCYLLFGASTALAAVDIGNEYAFGDLKTLGEGVGRLVYPTFSIAAAIVILYFLAGAFRLLMSGGEKETVAGARNMITHAIIGFIILIFAFLVLQFILSAVFGIKGLNLIGV